MYINTGRRMVWLNMLFWLRPVPVFNGHRTERHQELPHVQVAKSQKIGEQASKSWNILNILLNIHKHLILLNIFDFQRYAAAFFCAILPVESPSATEDDSRFDPWGISGFDEGRLPCATHKRCANAERHGRFIDWWFLLVICWFVDIILNDLFLTELTFFLILIDLSDLNSLQDFNDWHVLNDLNDLYVLNGLDWS